MGRSILSREEVKLLQNKYIPEIHKEYTDVVKLVSLVAEKAFEVDGDELYLSDRDQRRLLKKVVFELRDLTDKVKETTQYIKAVGQRLKLDE